MGKGMKKYELVRRLNSVCDPDRDPGVDDGDSLREALTATLTYINDPEIGAAGKMVLAFYARRADKG